MSLLNSTLRTLTQRVGSGSMSLESLSERQAFLNAISSDITDLFNQHNNVTKVLFNELSTSIALNALDFGLSGNVIFTHVNADAADSTVYWDTTNSRARTIKESMDVLLSELVRIENLVEQFVAADEFDDSALQADIDDLGANLSQLKMDTVGDLYSWNGTGAAENTYSLSQLLDSVGAFFTGWPTTGNSYTGAGPSLTFTVDVSDLNFDTTIAQTNITDLVDNLTAIRTFVGMQNANDSSPEYSQHGTLKTLADGDDLVLALYNLDQVDIFARTAGVVSNSKGTYASDNFVFGSSSLEDTGSSDHDSRMVFDKNIGFFGAGVVQSTQWNSTKRGSSTAVFGYNNIGNGAYSIVTGTGNILDKASPSDTIEGCALFGSGNTIWQGTGILIQGSACVVNLGSADNLYSGVFGADHTLEDVTYSLASGTQHTLTTNDSCFTSGYGITLENSTHSLVGGNSVSADNFDDGLAYGFNLTSTGPVRYSVLTGQNNTFTANADLSSSVILGGLWNVIETPSLSLDGGGIIASGYSTVTDAGECLIYAGHYCKISGAGFATASGVYAEASIVGQHAQGAGTFGIGETTQGHAQSSVFVASADMTSSGSSYELCPTGDTAVHLSVGADRSAYIRVDYVVRYRGVGVLAHTVAGTRYAIVENVGGILSIVSQADTLAPTGNTGSLTITPLFTVTGANDEVKFTLQASSNSCRATARITMEEIWAPAP